MTIVSKKAYNYKPTRIPYYSISFSESPMELPALSPFNPTSYRVIYYILYIRRNPIYKRIHEASTWLCYIYSSASIIGEKKSHIYFFSSPSIYKHGALPIRENFTLLPSTPVLKVSIILHKNHRASIYISRPTAPHTYTKRLHYILTPCPYIMSLFIPHSYNFKTLFCVTTLYFCPLILFPVSTLCY